MSVVLLVGACGDSGGTSVPVDTAEAAGFIAAPTTTDPTADPTSPSSSTTTQPAATQMSLAEALGAAGSAVSPMVEAVVAALGVEGSLDLCPPTGPLERSRASAEPGDRRAIVVDAEGLRTAVGIVELVWSVGEFDAGDAVGPMSELLDAALLTGDSAAVLSLSQSSIGSPTNLNVQRLELELDSTVLASTVEEIDAVVCVSLVGGEVTTSCPFPTGGRLDYVALDVVITVYDPATGELIAERTLLGDATVRECPRAALFKTDSPERTEFGEPVPAAVVADAIDELL